MQHNLWNYQNLKTRNSWANIGLIFYLVGKTLLKQNTFLLSSTHIIQMKKNAHFTAVFGFHLYFPLCLSFVWDSRPVPEVNVLYKTRHNYYPFLVEIYAEEEFTAYEHTWYRSCKKFCHQTLGSSPWTCCYLLQFSPDSLMGGELLCDHHPSYHLRSQPQKKKRINSQHNSQNVITL